MNSDVNNDNIQVSDNTNFSELNSENVETLLSENDDLFFNVPFDEKDVTENKISNINSLNNDKITTETMDVCFTSNDSNIYTNQNVHPTQNIDDDDDDDMLIDECFEPKFKKHNLPQEDKIVPNPKKISIAKFDDMDTVFEDMREEKNLENNLFFDNDWKQVFCDQPNPENFSNKFSQNNLPDRKKNDFLNSSSSFVSINQKVAINMNSSKISNKPFVYLKHIKQIKLNHPCIFTIKAMILTLKKKITLENDKFSLQAIITDGSECLDVTFTSNILENILNYSPCELQAMMKEKEQNSAIGCKIKEIFKKAQEKFISLNCLMKIKFFPNENTPIVLHLEDLTPLHLNQLKNRLDIS